MKWKSSATLSWGDSWQGRITREIGMRSTTVTATQCGELEGRGERKGRCTLRDERYTTTTKAVPTLHL